MILEYFCVIIMMAFCYWSLYIGVKTHPVHFPMGNVGRWMLIVNSLIMTIACAVVLFWRVIEAISKS